MDSSVCKTVSYCDLCYLYWLPVVYLHPLGMNCLPQDEYVWLEEKLVYVKIGIGDKRSQVLI